MFYTKQKEKRLLEQIESKIEKQTNRIIKDEVDNMVEERVREFVNYFTSTSSFTETKQSPWIDDLDENKKARLHDRLRALFLTLIRADRREIKERLEEELRQEVLSKDVLKEVITELNSLQLDSKK